MPVAPVLSVVETIHHPHHRARGTVRTVHDRLHGDFDMPGMPLKFSRFPKDLPLEAATFGQHNAEILTRTWGGRHKMFNSCVPRGYWWKKKFSLPVKGENPCLKG